MPAAQAMSKHAVKLLLSPPIERPRITDELAGCFDSAEKDGAQAPPIARVVSPYGKVWRVEVGRDDGAFLGRGWPEFLAAHSIDVGWFVVLRHEGRGVLTVKVFDASFCIKEFHPPSVVPSITANKNIKGTSYKPQFIRVMHKDFMEKMMIPARFVKQYITDEYLNSQIAVILSPLGKFWRVKIEEDQSGMFFSGDWSSFVEFHSVSEGDVLLIKYEGNMVFKFKAFDLNESKKDNKNQDIIVQPVVGKQQEGDSGSLSRKRKSSDGKQCYEGHKRSNGSITSLNKTSSVTETDNQTGSVNWIKKEITASALKHGLSLSAKFCRKIGFHKSCTIQLKTEMDSTRSWKVNGLAYTNACYLGEGWKIFCKDNRLKEGDFCTFNIVKTMLWHVTIMRLSDNEEHQKSPRPNFGIDRKSESSSIDEGLRGPDGSRTSIKRASYNRCIYEIGPPAWIRKKMATSSLQRNLFLARHFFVAIGLKEPCTITLKTSITRSAQSWQVVILKRKNGNYLLGDDWWKFCQDNELKEGDTCLFNVVNTTLWQVAIARG